MTSAVPKTDQLPRTNAAVSNVGDDIGVCVVRINTLLRSACIKVRLFLLLQKNLGIEGHKDFPACHYPIARICWGRLCAHIFRCHAQTWLENVTVGSIASLCIRVADKSFLSGCGGSCVSTSSCNFLHALNDAAVKKFHCQACLLPLSRVQGENLHPSLPGWRSCDFKYREHVRRYLVLASQGTDIKIQLPKEFPTTGPIDAMEWAFKSNHASPPNIVFFVAALLGLN